MQPYCYASLESKSYEEKSNAIILWYEKLITIYKDVEEKLKENIKIYSRQLRWNCYLLSFCKQV